jgi:hypothetical protein
MKKLIIAAMLTTLTLMSGNLLFVPAAAADTGTVYWLNHLDLMPGDPSVQTSFNAVSSGVGGGLSGLLVKSTTTGEDAQGGGNKVVEMGVAVPPWNLVTGVRVCYELTNAGSYISQTRIDQLQNPPSSALVLLDDDTNLIDPGPVCVNSTTLAAPYINPATGGLRLSFRVNFGNVNDAILIRGVALTLVPDPESPLQQQIDSLEEALENHTHKYLTGKGVGHNNTQAVTSPPVPYLYPVLLPSETVKKGPKNK